MISEGKRHEGNSHAQGPRAPKSQSPKGLVQDPIDKLGGAVESPPSSPFFVLERDSELHAESDSAGKRPALSTLL